MMEQPGIRAAEGSDRRFILSFSSETPVSRWFGSEVLDHTDGAIDLTRLNELGCVLYNHNRDNVLGRILRAWAENSRGMAEIEFDGDEASDIICQKVRSGTLKGVSVGYRVDSWEEVMPGKASSDGRFTGPVDIARKWAPYEISIVSVPADANVGVGRNFEEELSMADEQTAAAGAIEERAAGGSEDAAESAGQGVPPDESADQPIERALAAERSRVAEISALCRFFDLEPDEYIKSGTSLADTQAAVLRELQKTRKPVSVSVTQDERDKFRAAASDGLMLRGGLNVENPAPGAGELRALSMRELAIECLTIEGAPNARRMDNDMLLRQFYNPSSAFPSIMDDTIQKAYTQGYQLVQTTFEQWTSKGSLKDFKETKGHYYLAGPAGEFLLVPEGGELKADMFEDKMLPQRKLETYGRQFTMTREAFINDDIGFLTTLPSRYAASAKRTINNQVYKVLVENPKIYDGEPLFSAEHQNVVDAGTDLTPAVIQKMILMLKKQRDPFGQAMIVHPRYLIVPVGWEFKMRVLFGSPTINTPDNTQAVNPLYNYPFSVVEDPALDALTEEDQPMPWFMVGDSNVRGTIQVDYLNGQEMPIIRRMERPGQLGFIWDIYLDWGVNVLDYRGMLKNPGVAPEE